MAKKGLVMIDFDLRKIKNLEKALKKAPLVVRDELAKAVQEMVVLIEGKAKELCPVDTGNLRASITPVVESWAEAYVGTNVHYAPHVEFGTRKMAAQPFLEPAFEYGRKMVNKVFGRAVSRAISKVGKAAR